MVEGYSESVMALAKSEDTRRGTIHRSAWQGNSRKSAYSIVHIMPPQSPKARSSNVDAANLPRRAAPLTPMVDGGGRRLGGLRLDVPQEVE
jgi:hypothetical protein